MARIGSRTLRVNQKLEELLPAGQIEKRAMELGHEWRERKLGPVMTVYLWIMQVLLCNLSGASSRHLHSKPLSPSAVCQAKGRLPLQLLRRLCAYLVSQIEQSGTSLWHEHRVFAADAVSYYTPDTPELRKAFGSKKTYGFPLLKSLSLSNLCNGVMTHQIPLPHDRQETPLVGRILRHLLKGDILILDRAFASFWNLLQAQQQGIHLLVRLKQCFWAKAHTRRTVIKRLGKQDVLVRWTRPRERCKLSLFRWVRMISQELTLRQVSICVKRRGYRPKKITLITTLLDPVRYPAKDMALLYHRRWEIETCFRHLKQTLNLAHLRSQTLLGVKKELLVRMMAYNLVRATMQRIAEQVDVQATRVSFADTLQWLILSSADSSENNVIINPLRPHRIEPRRLKRQNKNFLPFNSTRAEARKAVA